MSQIEWKPKFFFRYFKLRMGQRVEAVKRELADPFAKNSPTKRPLIFFWLLMLFFGILFYSTKSFSFIILMGLLIYLKPTIEDFAKGYWMTEEARKTYNKLGIKPFTRSTAKLIKEHKDEI